MPQHTTVLKAHITLKRDLEMSTGYRGRGLLPRTRTFPAGTRVNYDVCSYSGEYIAHDGDEITEVRHFASCYFEGEKYTAVKIFVPKKK